MDRDYYLEAANLFSMLQKKVETEEISVHDIPVEQLSNQIKLIYSSNPMEVREKSLVVNALINKAISSSDKDIVSMVFSAISLDAIYYALQIEHESRINANYMYQVNKERVMNPQILYWKNLERNYEAIREVTKDKSDFFSGKGVIYSAITGGYDDVTDPEYIEDDFDYILFTDNRNIKSDIWKVVYLENEQQLDNVRLARHVKIMGHEYLKGYDYSVWVDGKIRIIGSISDYIEKYKLQEPIICFNHYSHNNLQDEMTACLQLNKDKKEKIIDQIETYKKEGFDGDLGMIDSAVLVRDLKSSSVMKLMSTWWDEVKNKTVRDQLSFHYACWKTGVKYDTSDLYIYDNEYFTIKNHNR